MDSNSFPTFPVADVSGTFVPKAVVEVSDVTILPEALKQVAHGALGDRPDFIQKDVWAIVEEYITKGGLLDLTAEIAALHALELQVQKNEKKDLRPSEVFSETRRILESRSRMKAAQMQLLKARREFLTYDVFGMFLEGLGDILERNVKDPLAVQRIGKELGVLTQMLSKRVAEAA